MASRVAELVIKVTADAKQATSELNSVSTGGDKMRKGLGVASKASAAALLAVGAAAISAGRAAAEDAQSQAVLAKQMENSAGSTKTQVAAMEEYISAASAASGVADDELRPAMANLIRATGDAEKSQKGMSVALDVAAATGKSVESVTQAMAKGYGGSAASLKKLVPTLSDAAVESGNMSQIMKELADQTGGASAAAADTAAGKMQRFGLAMSETQEAIGGALLPAMSKMADLMLKLATAAQEHPQLFLGIAIAVGVVATAIIALNIAMTVYTAVTTLAASTTLAAWAAAALPIIAVVAVVLLVVGAVVLLWHKSETFRTVVLAVWGAVKTAVDAVITTVGKLIQKVSSIQVPGAIKTAFDAIKDAAHWAWDKVGQLASKISSISVPGAIKTALDAIKDAAHWAWQKAGDLVAKLSNLSVPGAVKTALDAIKEAAHWAWEKVGELLGKLSGLSVPGAVTTALNAIKTAADNAITAVSNLIGWLSRIKVPSINIPGVGKSAPQPAAVATGPTPVGFRATSQASTRAVQGGTTIVVQGALDPEAVARQIQRVLAGHDRRIGLRVT